MATTVTATISKDASGIVQDNWVSNDTGSGSSLNGATDPALITDGWNGSELHHPVGALRGTGWEYIARSFIYAPISFSGVQTTDTATLWLKQYPRGHDGHAYGSAGGSVQIYVRRLTRDFGEAPNVGEATWKQSSSNQWTFKKSAQRYSSVDGAMNWTTEHQVTKTITQSDNAWVQIDITNIANDWFDHSRGVRNDAPNYGLILIAVDEFGATGGMTFYARESGTTNTGYIVLNFNQNNAPNAPDHLAPTGDAVLTDNLSFKGTANDPDANDYLTGVEVVLMNDAATTTLWDSGKITLTGGPTTFNVQYGDAGAGVVAPAVLDGNKFYKWKAKTWDKAGAAGPYTTLQRFKLNTSPSAPAVALAESPLSAIRTQTPTVKVTHQDGDPGDSIAYGYHVWVEVASTGVNIYDSGDFVLTSGARATTVSVTLPQFTEAWGTQYRVKARTQDSNGAWGATSDYVYFTTYKTAVPTNMSPSNDTLAGSATPILSGQRGSTQDTLTTYEIRVFADDGSTSMWAPGATSTGLSGGSTFSRTYAGSGLTAGLFYRWQARATATIGGTSDWTALMRFQVPSDATIPEITAPLGSGIQGGGTNTLRPAFTGRRTTTFNRYQLEVYPNTANQANLANYTTSGSAPDATHFFASGTQSATIAGPSGGFYTFTYAADTIPALLWSTTYKVRARVSQDAGVTWSGWSGLQSFTMDVANTPTITAPTANQWITSATPTITVARASTDTLDNMQIRVLGSNGTTILVGPATDTDFTTNLIDAGAGTTSASWTYSGPTLTGGNYFIQARIQKYNNGPWSNWTNSQGFRLNSPPAIPTNLEPFPNEVIADDTTPTFKAKFSDPDVATNNDLPSLWEIEITAADGSPAAWTESLSTGLVVGINEWEYSDGSHLLTVAERNYVWRTRFTDSKGVAGAWSGLQGFTLAVRPYSDITSPVDQTVINDPSPLISWTYHTGGGTAQSKVNIKVFIVTDESDHFNGTGPTDPPLRLAGTSTEVLTLIKNIDKTTSVAEYQFTEPVFQDKQVYQIEVTVYNTDNLADPDPQVIRVWTLLDAPPAIQGLSATIDPDRSLVLLAWNPIASPLLSPLGNTLDFKRYNVYKKLLSDDTWTFVESILDKDQLFFRDYYAGNQVRYEYRVTVVAKRTGSGGIELESPDPENIVEAYLNNDDWTMIGADRDDTHIYALPVVDAQHTRVIQQEAFETLGSDRKVVIRGFVLGHEGSISMIFTADNVHSLVDWTDEIAETVLGRRLLDYMIFNAGPHILKSPFGDVWDIEIEGPQYKWLIGGHLQVDMNWTETGSTSRKSI